jgi:hypothetical protein
MTIVHDLSAAAYSNRNNEQQRELQWHLSKHPAEVGTEYLFDCPTMVFDLVLSESV